MQIVSCLNRSRGATQAEIPYALAEINLEIIGNQVEISGNQLKGNQRLL